jgi:hypothetical protein
LEQNQSTSSKRDWPIFFRISPPTKWDGQTKSLLTRDLQAIFFFLQIHPPWGSKFEDDKTLFKFEVGDYLGAFQPSLSPRPWDPNDDALKLWDSKNQTISEAIVGTIPFLCHVQIQVINKRANLSNWIVVQSDVNPIMSSSCHSFHLCENCGDTCSLDLAPKFHLFTKKRRK